MNNSVNDEPNHCRKQCVEKFNAFIAKQAQLYGLLSSVLYNFNFNAHNQTKTPTVQSLQQEKKQAGLSNYKYD